MMEHCKTCRFWNFDLEHRNCDRLVADHFISDCRRHAPVARDYWAKTRGDDGCGDHQPCPEFNRCCMCRQFVGDFQMAYSSNQFICQRCYQQDQQTKFPADYSGEKCTTCGKWWTLDARDWLHLAAPGRVDHICDACRGNMNRPQKIT